MNDGAPVVDGFVGARPRVAHAQAGIQVDIVRLATPAMAVNLESELRLKTQINTSKVRRGVWLRMPFVVDDMEVEREVS